MIPKMAMLLIAAMAASDSPVGPARPPPVPAPPAYLAAERAVDNWRRESALGLDHLAAADADPAQTPRCVKLNNYWCVKRGGWTGEIAADGEGHVAFATAEDGAAVAALLLRRYYLDYKRRSARAIVSRWAPARCLPPLRPLAATTALPPPEPEAFKPSAASALPASKPVNPVAPAPRRPEQTAPPPNRMMPQRVISMGIAPRGIENTLRARWLAAQGRRGVASAPEAKQAKIKARRRATAESGPDLEPAPPIAVGMGEPAQKTSGSPPPLVDACVVTEGERVANYAARVIAGVVGGPDDDLALFSADGAPTDNLAKVMANMAAVEIGPLRTASSLIASGIAQMTRMLAKPKSADSTAAAPIAENAAAAPVDH